MSDRLSIIVLTIQLLRTNRKQANRCAIKANCSKVRHFSNYTPYSVSLNSTMVTMKRTTVNQNGAPVTLFRLVLKNCDSNMK